ncbi:MULTISPECIES: type I restriction endonuclease subunit R [Bacteroidales]|uniref:Type I restriction enzyme endonuclease subunit n=5 Tax=Bacteroides acidifaciens TaxID=85831 RepID=A0A4S2AVN6_9BACE|nr:MULTISPECIES: type I restriction endonuclease subunit R [Bacteroidales]MBF0729502.1 type I restriction endonuclease subunit R [Bacteroides acidifaciens]MBF0835071.1 type I restriction endonuclease subunit R [Bacteroides acidifaciens]NDO52868.1 type I restriction endonuclease subunit R [Bacteroides acidifaciens]TFU50010.1 type I restriction endonuclease subunit R [Bacteroides acidifaciens]TGY05345.1 type I restriction endonuclease subunit R [Bacteroides acidifaciens]
MSFTEGSYEKALIALFENLGYQHQYGPNIERDYYVPFYEEQLIESLTTINYGKPRLAIDEAISKLKDIEIGSLPQRNELFMDYLQHGIEVSFFDGKEQRNDIIYLIDYNDKNIKRNDFKVINQWTFVENSEKRADIILFVNGLPLVVIELKSPSREETNVSEAYLQLRNYMKEIPSLFVYNVFCVMSDMACSKAGTITSNEDRYMEWKTKDGKYESSQFIDYDTFFEGIFIKERFIDIIKNFICFSKEESGAAKILAAYHQYFAVKKAVERTKKATQGDGKIGVFWHTQGSGKSLSMVFYAHLLQDELSQPTIVVITDRNDLDDQLYTQFSKCQQFLRQIPIQAKSREDLKSLLAGREANGIIFTTMQKFEESDEPLSLRRNIVVMTDEAHRGQYGFEEKVNEETGKISIGTARIIHNSLPNASFIGFTGTPISTKDRDTTEVFGDYIDIYDMTQAVSDGATCPVYYESRVINLNLDKDTLKAIDDEYEILASEGATEEQIEKSKKQMSHLEEILGAPATIDSLCKDIINHYEENRQFELTGKAMIVAYSRPIAMSIYHRILELRPDWTDKVKVVMTGSNKDPEEWHDIIGNKQYKKELAKKFKDNNDPMKIAIVVDMWLTGFDVPSLATMYVYKPMSGHNLMQAIARVNRVFNDKAGGLVVDYIGIAKALKQAMHDYTVRDQKRFGNPDIKKTALIKFQEKLEVCRDIFHGFDYSNFQSGTDNDRAQIIKGGVNFLMDSNKNDKMQLFQKESSLLHSSITLCRSLLNEQQRYEAAFFETVRILLSRMTGKGKVSKKEINARIGELIKQSVKSEGIINLFSDVKAEFSIFDTAFLEEISKMKEKNIAIELLKKLLAERVTIYQKTNLVQAEKFSDLLNRALSNYLKGLLTNEEVIQELLKLAAEISESENQGNELGLTAEEKSFYDALTKPRAVQDIYTNEQLVAMTKELTDALRKNRTIDWQKKESARAGMRRMIKRLLKKYKYPPEEAENALETVIHQCEQWTDNDSDEYSINESIQKYNFQPSYYSIAADEIQEGYNKKNQ